MFAATAQQQGFDFADEVAVDTPQEDAPGTWLDVQMSASAYRAYITSARQRIEAVPPPLRKLFSQALDLADQALAELDTTIEDGDDAFSLPWIEVPHDDALWLALEAAAAAPETGIEARCRRDGRYAMSAIHIEGLGSLVGRRWDGASRVIDYSAGRDPELIASYQDSVSPIALPASVWRSFYAAHKIAESYDAPAPVPALQFQGRRVVITSGLYHGRHATGHGWAVVAAEDWHGPTYSYRSQCRAWDEGRKERGDQRGLLVRVDRQLCVLAEYVVFVDENDTSHLATEDEASGASTTEAPAAEHVGEGDDDGDA